jgi:hypothetical protein
MTCGTPTGLDAASVHDQEHEVCGLCTQLQTDAAAFDRIHRGRTPWSVEVRTGADGRATAGQPADKTARAADRAQSTAGLIAKLKIVEEESDESQFWLECLFVAKPPSALHSDAKVLQDQFVRVSVLYFQLQARALEQD